MTLTLALPFFNQLHEVKGIMALLKMVTSPKVEWLIIDNGSTDPVESFFRDTLRPKRLRYVRNCKNLGMVKTYNQIFSLVETDLVAVLHNDVFIYELGWDKQVIKAFTQIPKLGCAGFFGAAGCGPIGERLQDPEYPGQMAGISNLLEADQHGLRLQGYPRPAAILDGFAMIFSMKMIDQAKGLDTHYQFHHLYDRDLPLTSLALGYQNVVIPIPCHHQSGVTANQAEYQTWINQQTGQKTGDSFTHEQNTQYFKKKWAEALPLYVEKDYSFRTGRQGPWVYQGDSILTTSPQSDR